METAFCVRCGAALTFGDRFCGACGTAVPGGVKQPGPPVAAAPPPPPIPAAGERVVGVIPQVVEVKGFLGMKTSFMNLVVTDRRLIFAVQSDAMWDVMDAEEKRMEVEFEHQGGQWRQYLESHDFGSPPWRVYERMSPDQICREQRENLSFPLSEISSATLVLNRDPDCRGDDLKITVRGQEREFGLMWENGETAYRILCAVMPIKREESE